MPDNIPYTFYHDKVTIGATATRLSSQPLIFLELDIQIQDNDVYVGDHNNQQFSLSADDIISYRSSTGIDLRQIYMKYQSATAYAVVMGVLKV